MLISSMEIVNVNIQDTSVFQFHLYQ